MLYHSSSRTCLKWTIVVFTDPYVRLVFNEVAKLSSTDSFSWQKKSFNGWAIIRKVINSASCRLHPTLHRQQKISEQKTDISKNRSFKRSATFWFRQETLFWDVGVTQEFLKIQIYVFVTKYQSVVKKDFKSIKFSFGLIFNL